MALTITESWIRDRVNLKHDHLDDVKSLSLPGSYHEKIVHLGNSLRGFTRLKHLDLSRNDVSILDGLDHLKLLETLNLYYNNVTNLKELYKLRFNTNLKEIDLRLNPVTKNEPDYRLFVIHMIPNIRVLDDRSVRDSERKAALEHFVSDQASKFEASPRRRETQDQKNERTSSARVELVSKLASRPSALADDDIALIDLISKADSNNNLGSATKSKIYQAESYNSKELEDTPQPHSEKYAHFHSSSPENDQPRTKEKNRVSFRDDRRDIGVNNRNTHYDDYHPFATNGNFTPNPTAHARHPQSYQSKDRRTGREVKDFERYSAANGRRSFQKDEDSNQLNASTKRSAETYVVDAAKEQMRANRHAVESNVSNNRFASTYEMRSESDFSKLKQNTKDTTYKEIAFVNSSDFNIIDNAYRNHKQGGTRKIPEEKMSIRFEIEKNFLMEILDLVDKYWNGSKSLQKNAKFQSLAHDAVSSLLSDHQRDDASQNVAGFQKDLESRDKEIERLHVLLGEHEADKEVLKKRLQDEDEIQRTIEMTDQDLRRLQQKIEEVQSENKALKATKISSDNEREIFDQLSAEAEELRQCKQSLERENHTLIQQCEQHSTTLTQLQELTSMLQESHRSLVVTNDHLLQELDETRQRHQHEVQQLHWSYEQLKKTADWLPRSAK